MNLYGLIPCLKGVHASNLVFVWGQMYFLDVYTCNGQLSMMPCTKNILRFSCKSIVIFLKPNQDPNTWTALTSFAVHVSILSWFGNLIYGMPFVFMSVFSKFLLIFSVR